MRKPYPTDLSDAEWTRLQSYLPSLKAESRLRTHSLRDVLDAIFYIVRSGCAWRLLPHDFPPWSTVFDLCHPRRRTGPGRSAPLTRWAGTAGAPPEEDLGRRRVQRQGTGQVVRGAGRVGARGRRARQGGQGL